MNEGSADDRGLRQVELLAALTAGARRHADVAQLWVLGSARQPELLDRWSDVDVGLVLRGPVPLLSLLPADSVVWALDRHPGEVRSTFRVVLTDGQRLDLVVATADEFRRADGRCDYTDEAPADSADGALVTPETLDASVDEARFVAALAVMKYGRADLLIGSHLTLELAQLCLVQAMLLRDRDEGTTSHRFGTGRDALAAGTWTALTPGGQAGVRCVQLLVEEFDKLHSELDARYAPDWSGLESLTRLLGSTAGPEEKSSPLRRAGEPR